MDLIRTKNWAVKKTGQHAYLLTTKSKTFAVSIGWSIGREVKIKANNWSTNHRSGRIGIESSKPNPGDKQEEGKRGVWGELLEKDRKDMLPIRSLGVDYFQSQ
ncbi:exodeoxyribonuclease V subunit alpha [Anopheles sinensis]|uniref:Exodeoxyribonuclease V subunit alpha n=1 Tax=Anopheles sinensis TaxID=74873 RepID=A0A084WIH2_ANOSI|nr:exodeoxyribonuclease V subunit alpha [Anopheles sinensis]